MGMCLFLQTLRDDTIRKVLADPPLIWLAIAPDEPEIYAAARKEQGGGIFRRLLGKDPAAKQREGLNLCEDETATTDLEKAWHGIHYLLTSSAEEGNAPLDFLVVGGQSVGDIEVGYGPARVFTSGEVRAIHAALASIDEAALRARFTPAHMMELEIYPAIWDRDPAEDDTLGYCVEYFVPLKAFVAHAADKGLGLVITIQ